MTIFSDIKNLLLPAGKRLRVAVFYFSPCQPHGTGLKVRLGSFSDVLIIIAEQKEKNNKNFLTSVPDHLFKRGYNTKAGEICV
jgi:hypothetical protein